MKRAVDLVLNDCRVSLPQGEVVSGWLAVDDGRVVGVGAAASPSAREVVDCQGMILLPGAIDMHVHFRDPGRTEKEDFASGSTAAVCGGVTTVADMPNDPAVVTPADIRRKIEVLRGRSFVDYALYAELGESARWAGDLRTLGVAGFKWLLGYDPLIGAGRVSRAAVRDSLWAASREGILVCVHAESPILIRDLTEEVVASGIRGAQGYAEARPPLVEVVGVAEAAACAGEFGCRLHVAHLSSAEGLRMALAMRSHFPNSLSIETCPHYLLLTSEDVAKLGSIARVNPPIKAERDQTALWEALIRGEIDCVATDHAPHLESEKLTDDVWDALPGLVGVETLLPLLFHEVQRGRLPASRLLEVVAERPAAILGLTSKGCLLPGYDADMVLIDPSRSTTIRGAGLHSKLKRTVYEGRELSGRIEMVYRRGERIVLKGQVVGAPDGRYVASH